MVNSRCALAIARASIAAKNAINISENAFLNKRRGMSYLSAMYPRVRVHSLAAIEARAIASAKHQTIYSIKQTDPPQAQ
ncbi:MAG: hypothetical protein A3F13_01210 [Gammaproteobacteria bacterium RIFCSPHIGHO2_12_FULL_40_19]|nr:MAG: hypothetical protein A3F13_01210 [Gammaproteobacteria bacterium RIFCSPHIGHO2_12_FULL_40_19]